MRRRIRSWQPGRRHVFTPDLQQLVNQYQSRGFTHVICFGLKASPQMAMVFPSKLIVEMLLHVFE